MSNTLMMIALLAATSCGTNPKVGPATAAQPPVAFERIAMGPDPGGHSGDKVTPQTTKTGQPVENGDPKTKAQPNANKSTQDSQTSKAGSGQSPASGSSTGASSNQGGDKR